MQWNGDIDHYMDPIKDGWIGLILLVECWNLQLGIAISLSPSFSNLHHEA